MNNEMNIEQAKKILRDNWDQGIDCPCCGQLVKKYPRKLTSSMAVGLISLYRQSSRNENKPVHISKIERVNGGEFAQLERWGLIKQLKNIDSAKRTSGMWLITYKGVEFIKGNIQVPMYCDTYNGKTLGFSDETTTIKQALGNKFNYSEMMGFEHEPVPKAISWLSEVNNV